MKLTLTRKFYTDKSTIGELSIDGVFECHVIEDVVRAADAVKVYGQTAIPAGTYKLTVEKSPRFSAKAGKTVLKPRLHSVPGFEGVLIHEGNSAADSLGCLLVGQYDASKPDWVSNSKLCFNHLFPKLAAAQTHGEALSITIIDTKDFSKKESKKGVEKAKK